MYKKIKEFLLNRIPKQTLKRHLIVWALVLIKFTFFTSIVGSILSKVTWVATLMINFSFSYYFFIIYIWPNIFDRKKYHYIFLVILSGGLFVSIYYFQIEMLIPNLGGNLLWTGKTLDFQLKKFLINFSYVFFSSLGTYYIVRGTKQIETSIKLEAEILEGEFIFLKNQFHSHLTFNFLNFCYNRIRRFSPETSDYIEEFSYMLRYSLNNKLDQFIPLQKEIEYIEKFISFQKCLNDEFNVKFDYNGNLSVLIVPRILVIYVENSFKHGILHDKNNPIRIKVESDSSEIRFHLENMKNNKKNFVESGIGMENIHRILKLFYPNKHSINITNDELIFSCDLRINT